MASGHKELAEGIYGFQAHTVQPHARREDRGVVFCPGVELAYGRNEASERNAPAEVPHHGTVIFLYLYVYAFPVAFVEFVDAVVYGFLEQHIYSVFAVGAVAKASDVHAGSPSDVLHTFKVHDGLVAIVVFLRLCHVCCVPFSP